MLDPSFCLARACNARKDMIDAFAAKFAVDIGYEPGASLESVVQRLGGKLIYKPLEELGESADASVKVFGQGQFEVYLPDFTSEERNRFSIAHEIGHYILHYPLEKKPMVAARFGSTRVEWEANWFAAGFLMPAEPFRAQFEKTDGRLAEVAALFKVSTAAAEARARSLGLI